MISYVYKDWNGSMIKRIGCQVGDYPVIVAETLTVREALGPAYSIVMQCNANRAY